MVQPRLIHPIPCTIERINRAGTRYDPDAREPIQSAARFEAVTIPGQPKWTVGTELSIGDTGPTGDDTGYVLFRRADMQARGFMIEIGDRITVQGWLARETYVTRLEPLGHYTDQNGATLIKAWVTDRRPAKER